MARMKNGPNKKSKHAWLKSIVALEFAGIILVGLIFVILIFNPNLLSHLTTASNSPTHTLASTPPTVPTATSLFTPAPVSNQLHIETAIAGPILEFDLSSSNQVLPEDVLEEVAYYIGGGDGTECRSDMGDQHYTLYTPDQAEWLSDVRIVSCGWQPDETISVTVIYDGSVYATGIVEQHDGDLALYFLPISESMKLGDYLIVLNAPSGQCRNDHKNLSTF
jgi:hypothetical protein